MSRQVVVLAGGLGTRMRPHTERVPKVLLDVAGRPFVAWLLERLARCGYQDVVLSIAHLGEQVRDLVGNGQKYGVSVRYVDEGGTLLGTGGALKLALDRDVLDDVFLVTYGDSYLPFDYGEPLAKLRARDELDGVVAVFPNQSQWDASNTSLTADGDRVARYEKGNADPALRYIDYGATALRRSVIEQWPDAPPFGFDRIQHTLAKEGRLGAVVARERFFEIGSPQGLKDLEARLAAGEK